MSTTVQEQKREPKLLDRVREALRVRHMSLRTTHVLNRGGRGVQSPIDRL